MVPAALAASLACVLGCSGTVAASSESVDAEVSAVTAIVTVERTTGGTRGDVVARFVRARAGTVDEEALRMVGAAIELPALGTCSRATNPGALAKVSSSVELLNVGAVSLEADGYRANLVARALPDVVDLVSGVVYTARAEGSDSFPADGRYLLRATSTPDADFDVASFSVEANVPGEPDDLRVAGEDVNALIATNEPVEITWEPPPSRADAEDAIYVDVTGREADKIRCSFADSGRAILPPTAFLSDEGTVAVHRVHHEAFRARGIDSGVLRFDFARVVTFRRR